MNSFAIDTCRPLALRTTPSINGTHIQSAPLVASGRRWLLLTDRFPELPILGLLVTRRPPRNDGWQQWRRHLGIHLRASFS
jgi:hypothetical protein